MERRTTVLVASSMAPRRDAGKPVPSQSNWLPSTGTREPHRRVAGAADPVLAGAAPALGRQAQPPSQAPDGVAAHGEALDLAELLGAVAVIEVAVRGLDQLPYSGLELRHRAPGATAGPRRR